MAEFSIDELITPLTSDEIKSTFYEGLATVGVTTTTWKPGAVTRTMIAIVCVILAALSSLISSIARSGFLSLASGLWLRLKALYDYNEAQQLATFAAGTVLVTNVSGNVYILDPDDLEVASTITEKSYRNTAAVTINAGAVDVPVAVAAVEAGSTSSALIGEIDRVVSAYSGLRVRNAEVLVGLDDESPEQLRARCTEKIGSFSPNGPRDAYTYVARSAVRANGTPIGVTRVRPVRDTKGGLTLYCATASGEVAPADIALIDEQLQQYATSLCVTLTTASATAVPTNITYQAWCYAVTGVKESDIKQAVTDALALYFAGAPIGGNRIPGLDGRIYADDIATEIGRATYKGARLPIFRVVLSLPSSDVLLGVDEVATLGTVTGSVSILKQPGSTVD